MLSAAGILFLFRDNDSFGALCLVLALILVLTVLVVTVIGVHGEMGLAHLFASSSFPAAQFSWRERRLRPAQAN